MGLAGKASVAEVWALERGLVVGGFVAGFARERRYEDSRGREALRAFEGWVPSGGVIGVFWKAASCSRWAEDEISGESWCSGKCGLESVVGGVFGFGGRRDRQDEE